MTTPVRDPGGELAEPLGSHHEEWRPVPGYPDYEVSRDGRVKTWKPRYEGRILRSSLNQSGYPCVTLSVESVRRSFQLHQVVALAYIGPRPDGLEVRHLDGNKLNNHVGNLAYGTRAENMQDNVRLGVHPLAKRDACHVGHEFTPENTYWDVTRENTRRCRACRLINQHRYLERLHGVA